MTAEDFAKLEDWQLQEALQLLAGEMAVAAATQRMYAEAHQKYMEAKGQFSQRRQMASLLQTILRTKV